VWGFVSVVANTDTTLVEGRRAAGKRGFAPVGPRAIFRSYRPWWRTIPDDAVSGATDARQRLDRASRTPDTRVGVRGSLVRASPHPVGVPHTWRSDAGAPVTFRGRPDEHTGRPFGAEMVSKPNFRIRRAALPILSSLS
jgi:hypothetical protein